MCIFTISLALYTCIVIVLHTCISFDDGGVGVPPLKYAPTPPLNQVFESTISDIYMFYMFSFIYIYI